MTKKLWLVPSLFTLLVCLAPAVNAQARPKGYFSFGASLPQGHASDFLQDGWAIHGGAMWLQPSSPWGIRLDIGYDWWDAKSSALQTIDSDTITPGIQPPDNGDADEWSITGDFVWKPKTKGTVGFYMVGGVGAYYSQYDISEDGVVGGYWCDWWWGVCYPTLVPGEYVIASGSSWDWGWNVGVGITFAMHSGGELYLEANYHWVDTENSAEFLPITFGYRW